MHFLGGRLAGGTGDRHQRLAPQPAHAGASVCRAASGSSTSNQAERSAKRWRWSCATTAATAPLAQRAVHKIVAVKAFAADGKEQLAGLMVRESME